MSDPAYGTSNREDHSEHRCRDSKRFENDAGVEINVWIELLLNEVGVVEGDFFEALSDLEVFVLNAKLSKDLIGCLLHDFCTWVEVFVNPVTEAHQTEGVVLVLGFGNELIDTGHIADLVEHFNDSFVGTTVRGSPECRNTCCDTRKWVGLRRACQTYSRRGSVLLMVCVEQEDTVHCAGDGW